MDRKVMWVSVNRKHLGGGGIVLRDNAGGQAERGWCLE
jgi:hypothetical protein